MSTVTSPDRAPKRNEMSMSPRHPVDTADEPSEAATAPVSPSRRRFVRNVGLGAAALGAVAVTGTALTGVASAQTEEPPELDPADVSLLQFLQSLSLAADEGLNAAIERPFIGSEASEETRKFARHHGDHATAIGALLPETDAITAPNPRMLQELLGSVGGAPDEAALLGVLLTFEEDLSATMLVAMGAAQSFVVSGAIARIQPVVGQQAAAFGALSGTPITDWLPAFGSTAGAFPPADYPAR
jgi:hypothetical protein